MVRTLEQAVEAATGLPLSWYDALLELNVADEGRLRVQEPAWRVVLSRTRVRRLVYEIVQAGLVERQPDLADGRATFAVINETGPRSSVGSPPSTVSETRGGRRTARLSARPPRPEALYAVPVGSRAQG